MDNIKIITSLTDDRSADLISRRHFSLFSLGAIAAAWDCRSFYAVPSILFRTVERLVGRLQYKIRIDLVFRRSRNPNADRHRKGLR